MMRESRMTWSIIAPCLMHLCTATLATITDDHEHVYVCSNSDTIPPMPHLTTLFQDPNVKWPADPESYIGHHWASNSRPYQGFLPVQRADIFECDLFQCLNHTSTSLQVHSSGQGLWSLGAKVVDSWRNLEALLARLRQVLEVQAGHRNIGPFAFSFPLEVWISPCQDQLESHGVLCCSFMRHFHLDGSRDIVFSHSGLR